MTPRRPNLSNKQTIFVHLLVATLFLELTVNGMDLFQVRLVEPTADSRLIATSNYNYAMMSPKLASKGWRMASVNGDKVTVTSLTGEQLLTSRAEMGESTMSFLESLRDEMANSGGGYSHISAASGGSTTGNSFMMSSNTGGSSSSSSSFSTGDQFAMGQNNGDLSYSVKDSNCFSVSRSDFPFNWSRLFFNSDVVTLVMKSGDVVMLPISSLPPDQLETINRTRNEVLEMQRTQRQQISNTFQNSMNMVSNVFNSIMGSFPKPPSYQSAVGGMFGDNFPFGPNNNPFGAASGWPFGSGGGASAMAFAGRR